jgi:RNA polymerase sigma-70 factor (ECF subfamily)
MTANSSETLELLARAGRGDEQAFGQLFGQHRERLKRMVRLRLSRRLQGRLDESDVLQDAYLEICRRLHEFVQNPAVPLYLWLRQMTGLKLAELHRRHLGTRMRDADREVSIYRGALPEADSASLAAHLLGQLTSPSQAAIKAEMRIKLQEVLNSMAPLDREVIALRHFEQLSGDETAEVLGLSKTAASSRYVRAITRLRKILSQFPEFVDPRLR